MSPRECREDSSLGGAEARATIACPFCWDDLGQWAPVFLEELEREAPGATEALRKLALCYVSLDGLGWLQRGIRRKTGLRVDPTALLLDILWRRFDCLRAYHGARPVSVGSYYTDGLRPLEPQSAAAAAKAFFLTSADFLSESDVDQAIAAVPTDVDRGGYVHIELSRAQMLKNGTHFLLYGSEYVMAIAANLPNYAFCQELLHRRGVATLFECRVPLELIPENALERLAVPIAANLHNFAHGVVDATAEWAHGLALRRSLPGRCVMSHEHPEQLRDWHFNRVVREMPVPTST